MQIQDLSYQLNNDRISIDGYRVSVEVFGFDNVYTVEEGSFIRTGDTYFSNEILWGDTEKASGKVYLDIRTSDRNRTFKIKAELEKNIRCVKLRFDGLPLGKLISSVDEDKDITEYGLLLRYPEGWRSLSTPLLIFQLKDGSYLYVRCLDRSVCSKRFFIRKEGDGMRVDVVVDQEGTEISDSFDVPKIECGFSPSAESIVRAQSDFVKDAFQLQDYIDNPNVPFWFRDISLIVTMHMEAFTGHVFHTYEKALDDMKKITAYLPGRRILVYLAGWEGRYYYKYGDYTPDERLGGKEKLKELVDGLHALGCRVMAMYGMNIANKNLVGDLVDEAEFQSVSGAKYHSGSVDWEGAHHYDFNELAQLNVGCPKWQDYLYGQIARASREFEFDGAFLDIAACYTNDKNHNLYRGVLELCDRLRTIRSGFLIAGEGFYDGLAKAMPLFQSGHTDGWLHYHDRVSPLLFTRFSREFAHLCLGDVGRGSTGVHEQGTNEETSTPLREGILPTLALVEDTVDDHFDRVKTILDQAKEYARRYLDAND